MVCDAGALLGKSKPPTIACTAMQDTFNDMWPEVAAKAIGRCIHKLTTETLTQQLLSSAP